MPNLDLPPPAFTCSYPESLQGVKIRANASSHIWGVTLMLHQQFLAVSSHNGSLYSRTHACCCRTVGLIMKYLSQVYGPLYVVNTGLCTCWILLSKLRHKYKLSHWLCRQISHFPKYMLKGIDGQQCRTPTDNMAPCCRVQWWVLTTWRRVWILQIKWNTNEMSNIIFWWLLGVFFLRRPEGQESGKAMPCKELCLVRDVAETCW